jgi:hypothetical protein
MEQALALSDCRALSAQPLAACVVLRSGYHCAVWGLACTSGALRSAVVCLHFRWKWRAFRGEASKRWSMLCAGRATERDAVMVALVALMAR